LEIESDVSSAGNGSLIKTMQSDRENDMKDLITRIVQAMVDKPDQVEITEIKGQNTTVMELRVDKSDLGKVIGKKGNNAKAIRDILYAASAKKRQRVTLEIVE
jgi:uncharacterized protein